MKLCPIVIVTVVTVVMAGLVPATRSGTGAGFCGRSISIALPT